jgi:protein-S-isoprenylcysteine O-methyltransferase Ste14
VPQATTASIHGPVTLAPVRPEIRLLALVVAWFAWVMPFVFQRRRAPGKDANARIDSRARWGILLEGIGFGAVYIHGPLVWAAPLEPWRAGLGAVFAVIGIALAWGAVGNLGKQWRFDAGLNTDHELVQTGAYRFVRHPIYASMLWMLLMVVAWLGTLPGWPIGLAFFIAGTEIRVHIEDALLRDRFGERFTAWQRRVSAYVPFVR